MSFRALLTLLIALWLQPAHAAAVLVGGDDLVIGSSERVVHPIPAAKNSPMIVRTALAFVAVDEFDEQSETFHATVDLRLTWVDASQKYQARAGKKTKEYADWAAGQQMLGLWMPRVRLGNVAGRPRYLSRLMTISPDGTVEVLTRLSGDFKAPVDIARYPFDRQDLPLEIQAYGDGVKSLQLIYRDPDSAFSAILPAAALDGWQFERVSLVDGLVQGWGEHRFSQITAKLTVGRASIEAITALCLPLLASLLIPFLVIWLNRSDEGEFEVEAFELANVVIGGLFAVIALSITLSSSYPALVVQNNVVSHLLTLNYVSLAFGIFVVLFLYQFRCIGQWFGATAQRLVHLGLCWVYPIVTVILAGLILTAPLRA